MKYTSILIGLLACLSVVSHSQYNAIAGKNAPEPERRKVVLYDKETGEEQVTYEQVNVSRDEHGNAAGNQYDLAVDGAFEGQTIVVLHLYTGEGFDFSLPKAALAEKGFSVYRFLNQPPHPDTLKAALEKACQFWLISNSSQMLTQEHVQVISDFFHKGHGVYIWGDNEPYYADANFLSGALIDVGMNGNLMGDHTVGVKRPQKKEGIITNHLLSTGLEYIYEGITIATLENNEVLTPLIWGSAGNLVAGVYEKDGKRLILDGGFTRLYVKWDTAGTGRYVKNAAAWLVNYERFGQDVLGANQ